MTTQLQFIIIIILYHQAICLKKRLRGIVQGVRSSATNIKELFGLFRYIILCDF